MNILVVGDVVGSVGKNALKLHLNNIFKLYNIDFCIVNGENVSVGNGISLQEANEVIGFGVDVITTGNHGFNKTSVYEELQNVIRPLNYDSSRPGDGIVIKKCENYNLAVICLVGRVFLENVNCPFKEFDKAYEYLKSKADIIAVDFHAEATGEKQAFAHYVDGRASFVFGTHTHVQTSDEVILSGRTGYITDVGMTGPSDSVIGISKEVAIQRIVYHKRDRFIQASGPYQICGAVFNLDNTNLKVKSIVRIFERYG